MNRKKRNRMTLPQRRRFALLSIAISCSAASVEAGTQANPFFQATRIGEATVTRTAAARMPGSIETVEQSTASELGTFNFEAIDELVSDEASSPTRVPRLGRPSVATPQRLSRRATGPPRRLPGVQPKPSIAGIGSLNETASNSHQTEPITQTSRIEAELEKASPVSEITLNASEPAPSGPGLGVPVTSRMIDQTPSTDAIPLPAALGQPDSRLIAAAARRHSVLSSMKTVEKQPVATQWLQSITTESCSNRAAEFLDDAYREYSVAAWASAEASAWKALELIATGIDVAVRPSEVSDATPTASKNLRTARTAIREGRDFLASGAAVDAEQLSGIASSHQTPVFVDAIPSGLTPTAAVDRYLDYARLKLAPLAAERGQAAQAMDLIAAIQLGRNETKWLPEETSLCLRRAALQGKPSNASLASRLGMQLADMGLDDEAEWTLRHAMSLDPSSDVVRGLAQLMHRRGDREGAMRLIANLPPTTPQDPGPSRVPDVIQLSPAQFASISPPLNAGVPATKVDPSAETTSVRTSIATAATAPLERPPQKSRTISASLAGLRMPFTRQQAKPQDAQASETLGIEDNVDDLFSADEFQTDAGATPNSSEETRSPMKRLLGRFPKLW